MSFVEEAAEVPTIVISLPWTHKKPQENSINTEKPVIK